MEEEYFPRGGTRPTNNKSEARVKEQENVWIFL